MASISHERNTARLDTQPLPFGAPYTVATGKTVLQGTLVGLTSDSRLVGADDPGCLYVLGMAARSGAAGDKVPVEFGVFRFDQAAGDESVNALGALVYAADNQTLSRSSADGTRPIAGVSIGGDERSVWVLVGPYMAALAAGASAPEPAPSAFSSGILTGNGTEQAISHGLGAIPSAVLVSVYDVTGIEDGFVVTEGSHDTSNLKITVTSGAKFKVLAVA